MPNNQPVKVEVVVTNPQLIGKAIAALSFGVGTGVGWFVWGHYGFWWGVLYAVGWQVWAGYRLAEWLLR